MKGRMRKVIQAAIAHGNKGLMVRAFGCGVFGNVREVIATVRKELMVDNRLRFHFASVLNPVSPARRGNSAYHAFRRVLEQVMIAASLGKSDWCRRPDLARPVAVEFRASGFRPLKCEGSTNVRR
jgi:hypothetical protein